MRRSHARSLAEESGCSLHVVHVSTGRGVALVAEARARGADVSCETCPHYLVLTEDDAEGLGNVAKCAPPLRASEESEALWQALATGTLPMVGVGLDVIAQVTSRYVARRFRLSAKGRVEPGVDADLVLVDLTASEELSVEHLQYRHRHSPFVGRTLGARVAQTLVRGRTVFADGRIVGPPAGRLLIPAIETETP
ncbi:MAG: amidohydrolase family protein [Solirubrobacterales bacterium]|nr:amidohydrolase family protein [Solirubrobacterales bacterium]